MAYDSRTFSDYVAGLLMDVGSKFLPVPTVGCGHFDEITYPLETLEDEYDFGVERAAVDAYDAFEQEKQQAAQEAAKKKEDELLRHQEEKLKTDDEPSTESVGSNNDSPESDPEVDEGKSTDCPTSVVATNPTAPLPLVPLIPAQPVSINGILQPLPATKASSLITNARASDVKSIAPVIDWNDFERTTADPFDAVERNTIDDKALLSQILVPASNANAYNMPTQSVASTSSVLQNQPSNSNYSTISTYSTSVPSTSYQQNIPTSLAIDQNRSQLKPDFSSIAYPTFSNSFNNTISSIGDHNSRLNNSYNNNNNINNGEMDCISTLKPSKSSPDLCHLSNGFASLLNDDDLVENVPRNVQSIDHSVRHRSDTNSCVPKTDSELKKFQPSLPQLSTNQLSAKQRSVFDAINDMGFNDQRILRCLLQFGISPECDKVLNFLVAVDTLTRAEPSLPVDLIEQSILVANYDQDKAQQYARIGVQLCSLGFGSEKVCASLHRNNGRRDMALEELLRG